MAPMPAATAAAAPPLDPPGVRERSHGLRVAPWRRFSVTVIGPNSGALVRPQSTKPARRKASVVNSPSALTPLGQDAAIFATHCAGPRVTDLAGAGALPHAIVPVSRLRRPSLLLELAAENPFSGSGFSGRVVADVRVRIKRDRRLERLLLAAGTLTIGGGGITGTAPP